MARTNKYTSINFNHVLEKNLTSPSNSTKTKNPQSHHPNQPPPSFSSYSSISAAANAKTHGRMLVLTRPSPKPIANPPLVSPTPPKQSQPHQLQTRSAPAPAPDPDPDQTLPSDPAPDQISLRPLGRTGSGISIPVQEREKEVVPVSVSPKPDRFVPPHLRPGFVGREERPGPQVFRGREQSQKHFGSPGRYGEDGRPKSGGYEKMRGGGESDLGWTDRPRSSGNRPSSSG
ncbi:uncharacterized protein LOC110421605 [Herrania umbratica]|uniref:Uncharacterized protein LOC110421605 n=1 Tax=Herrania umbratica TaxID=108875 RepID=A0A6J1AVJ4_9ROSI|nr:uncharacterized protein LOC110421605 [Herrania umbratica]